MTKEQVVSKLLELKCVRNLVEYMKEDLKDGDEAWYKRNRLELRGMIILAKELKLIETKENSNYEIIRWLLEE